MQSGDGSPKKIFLLHSFFPDPPLTCPLHSFFCDQANQRVSHDRMSGGDVSEGGGHGSVKGGDISEEGSGKNEWRGHIRGRVTEE